MDNFLQNTHIFFPALYERWTIWGLNAILWKNKKTKTNYIKIQYSFMTFCIMDLICVFVQVRFQYTFETVLGFIVPYAIIIMCYVLILRRLRNTKFQRKVHSEKLILAIVVTFGIFWLPYHIINMLQVCRGLFLASFLLIQIFNSSLSPPDTHINDLLLFHVHFYSMEGGS